MAEPMSKKKAAPVAKSPAHGAPLVTPMAENLNQGYGLGKPLPVKAKKGD